MEKGFETVSERLKQIRLKKNYSQEYVASKIGLSQKAYSKIENNETRLSVETLLVLSDILETPIAEFFTNSQNPILNDFSSARTGDNVIYKHEVNQKMQELYTQLVQAKEAIILAKDNEINALRLILEKLQIK
jgi:transcriptional regulator with XRE-family HTH domain